MPESRLDRWVQRGTVAALVALALILLGVGVVLYAPALAEAAPGATVSTR